MSLIKSIDLHNREDELLYRTIKSNIENDNVLYTPISELDYFNDVGDLVNKFNTKLLNTKKSSNDYLVVENGFIYINSYEKVALNIVKKLDEYAAQAKESWGKTDAYKEFEEKSKDWTEDTSKNIAKDMMSLFVEFGDLMRAGHTPDSADAQMQVKKLQSYITDNFYNCTPQILAGLGKMYSGGGEFTANIDKFGGVGTAEYSAKAIEIYCM